MWILLLAGLAAAYLIAEKKPAAPANPNPGTPPPQGNPAPVTPPGQTVPPAQGIPPVQTVPGPTTFLAMFGAGNLYQLTLGAGLTPLIVPGLPDTQTLLVAVAPGDDISAAIANPIFAGAIQASQNKGNTGAWYAATKAQGHAIFYQVDPTSKFAVIVLDTALPGFLTA